jgi:dihydrofolate synthase/folylpolyglutamate synthase
LIFGCLADNAVEEMALILFPIFDHVILAEVNSPRAAAMSRLVEAAERTGVEPGIASSIENALEIARKVTPETGNIVVCGSVYLVGEVRQVLESEAQAR